MLKFFLKTTVFCMSLFISHGLMAAEFKEIMKSMEKSKIKLEFVYGDRPFKVLKDGDNWILEQQINYETSTLKDEGNNKISMNDFPSYWPINGTWAFSKNGSQCKITHTSETDTTMSWEC